MYLFHVKQEALDRLQRSGVLARAMAVLVRLDRPPFDAPLGHARNPLSL